MTISQYAAAWLKGYDADMNISTDQLPASANKQALIKSPNDSVRTDILGHKTVTAYLRFYLSMPSTSDAQRVSNQEYLEALQNWADSHEHPTAAFPAGTLDSISVSGTYGLTAQNETISIYQISITIIYRKD